MDAFRLVDRPRRFDLDRRAGISRRGGAIQIIFREGRTDAPPRGRRLIVERATYPVPFASLRGIVDEVRREMAGEYAIVASIAGNRPVRRRVGSDGAA